MAYINVEQEKTGEGFKFKVTVSEKGSQTEHIVSLTSEDFKRLTENKMEASELVKKSFEFLLEREPKESILGEFDLTLIQKYFPEYESKVKEWI